MKITIDTTGIAETLERAQATLPDAINSAILKSLEPTPEEALESARIWAYLSFCYHKGDPTLHITGNEEIIYPANPGRKTVSEIFAEHREEIEAHLERRIKESGL